MQADASDGFILVPHITPGGLDPFADQVVPLLQERGVFRTEYEGTTLRDHLGLAPPDAGAAADVTSPVGDVRGRSPGAGPWSSPVVCRHQHMTAVCPQPHVEYRRTRTT